MSADDAERWNLRHEDRPDPTPAPPDALTPPVDDPLAGAMLASLVSALPDGGTAIDVACGLGAQAVWAATVGLRVEALDVSPVAVERTRALADRRGVADRVRARATDLESGLPGDLVAADLVICQRYRQPDLYPTLAALVRPEVGLGVVTVLSVVGASEPGPFHAPAGELVERFGALPGVRIVRAVERGGQASVVFRRDP